MDVMAAIPIVGPTETSNEAAPEQPGSDAAEAFASLLLGLVSPVPLVAPSATATTGTGDPAATGKQAQAKGQAAPATTPQATGAEALLDLVAPAAGEQSGAAGEATGPEAAIDLVLPAPAGGGATPGSPEAAEGQAPADPVELAKLLDPDAATETSAPRPRAVAATTAAADLVEVVEPAAAHQRRTGSAPAAPSASPAALTAAAAAPATAAQMASAADAAAAAAPPAPAEEGDVAPVAPRTDAAATAVTAPSSAPADPVAAPTGAAHTAGAERSVAAQVVHHVSTLRHQPDGTYQLSMDLEPADLGRVRVSVTVEAGVVHVHVGADADATHDLLRRALPDLRAALADAGLNTGQLDVGGQHDRRAGSNAAASTPEGDLGPEQVPSRPVPTTRRRIDVTAGGVDVLL